MKALLLSCCFVAVWSLVASAGAEVPPPPGWTVQHQPSGDIYKSASDAGAIMVSRAPDQPDSEREGMARKFMTLLSAVGCPPANDAVLIYVLDRRAVQLKVAATSISCSAIVGRADGQLVVVGSIGRVAGTEATDAALSVAAGIFGGKVETARPSQLATTQPRPTAPAPVRPSGIGQSVPASGTTGVWVAITQHTVYDPVMAVRLEMGLDYLILTTGGVFMTDVPTANGFDDDAARAMARTKPKSAGQFRVQGNSLILEFASGETKMATASGAGTARTYKLDGAEYRPKRSFASGTLLNGSYSNTRISRTGVDSFVVGDHDLVFTREGRFARGGSVSVSGGYYSILGANTSNSGRYDIRDSAVHLHYDNGREEALSMWQEHANDEIWFDGDMYKLP